ncbi:MULTISPECIES: hypothetical protein [unclassified Streptomyces]|uniref:hypothetical protein n=1 Tax=unclassified Streptomyces TaxID=2593676 RepID=UPI000DC77205|nr:MULTISPECIES: hypothetical protein [unclassified Streptomyces]AWZ06663.1 hypothetical protein DRB89_20845 [Streptomyces sp. ICC4]AWZ12938.1 hypothetical protein DRB96_12045 [Streptomyces sp. ICC1]
MTRLGTAAAAAAALIVPLLFATGCGSIATTGVVESGSAATVKLAFGEETGLVYFVTPEGGIVPVAIPDGPSHPSPNYLISRLLAGPDETAREAGLTSSLPPADANMNGKSALTFTDNGAGIQVKLPYPVDPLSEPARRQVACTAVAAVRITPAPQVTLIDAAGKKQRAQCAAADGSRVATDGG